LVVIGLNPGGLFAGDGEFIMSQFKEQTGITFPLGWTTDNSYGSFRSGGGSSISPFPLDVVIGRDGTIRYISREYEPDQMIAIIEQALAE
jgi:peroxiredoxin